MHYLRFIFLHTKNCIAKPLSKNDEIVLEEDYFHSYSKRELTRNVLLLMGR